MDELEGRWQVERLSGALPPMVAVHNRNHGKRGETRFGHLLGLRFRIEEREDCPGLVYRPPFSMLVDGMSESRRKTHGGEMTLGRRARGRCRMTRVS
jgi:hypothetical protein